MSGIRTIIRGVAWGVFWAVLSVGCGGEGEDGPPVTDIFSSPECVAFCKRLESACPDETCDPMIACDELGDCLAEKRASLGCKADPKRTELTCQEMGGYSTIGVCVQPNNICR